MDGGWRRLPEVNDPRLIFTDVVHQHYATTEKQYREKALTFWTYPTERKNRPKCPIWSSHPPIPEVCGCTIPKQRAAAMAASTLDPCFARTSKPRDVHWAASVTTAPWLKTLSKRSQRVREKRKVVLFLLSLSPGFIWQRHNSGGKQQM